MMKKVKKNDKHLKKTYQKNIDDWQLLSLHQHFAKDVRAIRSRWGLPIPVEHIPDPRERLSKAYDTFLSERMPLMSYDVLRQISPEMHSYLDSRRIEELIKLQNETDVEDNVPEEVWRIFHDAEGRRKLRDLDWASPTHMFLLADEIALVFLRHISEMPLADLPAAPKVTETLTITPKDPFAVCLAGGISHYLHAGFLADIDSVARKIKPERPWFYPLLYYVLTGRDPREAGLIPACNIIVRKTAEGNFIFEETLETSKEDRLAARKHTQSLKGKRSKQSRVRAKQNRDLKIRALSERTTEDRIKDKEIEKNFEEELEIATERHLETLYISDDVIAEDVFGKRRVSRKTARRRRQVISKARSRLNKRIDEMYRPSP